MKKFKSHLLHGVQYLLALAGLILLVWMVRKIGVRQVQDHLLSFGLGRAGLLILLYLFAQLSFCSAWHVLLAVHHSQLTFWHLFKAYLAGDALNMSIPSANLAGEPVKILLVRDKIPVESALWSVTIYKYSDIVSMTVFLFAGWLNNLFFFSLPPFWNVGAGVVVGGMAGMCWLLYFLQHRGIYHPAGKWLSQTGWTWIVNKLESAHLVDKAVTSFYQQHPSKFFASLFFNFLAWFGGVAEILLFMAFSGLETSFAAALTIETFSMFINNVIFFVPGRLGVSEGGRVLLFSALGYSEAAGISYGIIRRIRELTWIGIGVAILAVSRRSEVRSQR